MDAASLIRGKDFQNKNNILVKNLFLYLPFDCLKCALTY